MTIQKLTFDVVRTRQQEIRWNRVTQAKVKRSDPEKFYLTTLIVLGRQSLSPNLS
ncbi:20137_t:CDS:2 [Rhizophagus irregularis]|nr:20137_t:CDS:2 [Rhizophagus irregularis]